jgi:GNAT superfamily N-acetyltransferase
MSDLQLFAPEAARLKNGETVHLRLIRPDDAPRLQAFIRRLSPESIFYRALEYRTELTDAEAALLSSVDGVINAAIVAVRPEPGAGDEQIIAVARYGSVGPERPGVAEAAIVVEDALQSQGLGTLLIERLVRHARANGIRRFSANIHYNNSRILHFIERSGLRVERKIVHGIWEFLIDIEMLNGFLAPKQR